jgi:hypothetical protein
MESFMSCTHPVLQDHFKHGSSITRKPASTETSIDSSELRTGIRETCCIVRAIRGRRMRWAGHMACMREENFGGKT